ncbi:hypothetical protein EVA_14068 [gut metagenome]|uniref:Uncharacterized protein n=1 Tax=gut metagenome TaxID=749906 RepID=J9CCX0_9ZZZZ
MVIITIHLTQQQCNIHKHRNHHGTHSFGIVLYCLILM